MQHQQFAKDMQTWFNSLVTCSVYEGEAPRNEVGSVSATYPFVVYTCAPSAPENEANIYTCDLLIDVWGRNGWAEVYTIAETLDNALHGGSSSLTSGLVFTDAFGLVCNRNEHDPDDERIRRLNSQYRVRLYPSIPTPTQDDDDEEETEQESTN